MLDFFTQHAHHLVQSSPAMRKHRQEHLERIVYHRNLLAHPKEMEGKKIAVTEVVQKLFNHVPYLRQPTCARGAIR